GNPWRFESSRPHQRRSNLKRFSKLLERQSIWPARSTKGQIAAIRAAKRGEGQSLTQRQALALAGEWYVWYVARHEENPGPIEHWRGVLGVLYDPLQEPAPPRGIEGGGRGPEQAPGAPTSACTRAAVWCPRPPPPPLCPDTD